VGDGKKVKYNEANPRALGHKRTPTAHRRGYRGLGHRKFQK